VHGEAVQSFKEATRYIQAGAHLYFRLGNSLFALDRFSEAEFAFKQAIEVTHHPLTFPLKLRQITRPHHLPHCRCPKCQANFAGRDVPKILPDRSTPVSSGI